MLHFISTIFYAPNIHSGVEDSKTNPFQKLTFHWNPYQCFLVEHMNVKCTCGSQWFGNTFKSRVTLNSDVLWWRTIIFLYTKRGRMAHCKDKIVTQSKTQKTPTHLTYIRLHCIHNLKDPHIYDFFYCCLWNAQTSYRCKRLAHTRQSRLMWCWCCMS